MTATDSFFAHWYFHIPNLLLAAWMYTLIGRYVLSLFFPENSDKVVWRVFKTLTDPVINAVGVVTPRIVPRGLLVLFAFAWLFAGRIALFLAFAAFGLRPDIGTGG